MDISQNKKKLLIFIVLIAVIIVVILLLQNNFAINLDTQQNKQEESITTDLKEFTDKQKEIFGQREATNPKDSSAKRELSRAYYLSRDYEKAEALIKEAIALDGSNPQFYVDFGRIYEAKKDTTNAEKMYKKAIELNTKEIEIKNEITKETKMSIYGIPTPYTALAGLYLSTNQLDKSAQILLEGIKVNEKYPYFYSLLSDVYEKLGDTQKSKSYEEQFQKLIK